MPDQQGKTLPSLKEVNPDDPLLYGIREEASIHKAEPLPKTCTHKHIQIISSTEIKCSCGAGWRGKDVQRLYALFKNQ